ncbi:uncharacterized protein CMU_034030 [Cryptosporidium muris RN66]|uniref:Protein kinase domain-containing protein n=1 Tax=Cryptosporidium muris (strain RN66) TaxID=441375 RepID=B6AFM7_CRYMR|nr:uncharacterized protein CMU_034030 [Cryptosporidium muris RN66]EEA07018.1 hypothetical protein, conserved [Cryptosporidium muris RN66]|eukprot:XP_002141367.1 hypothetical protein [Cryptosporidium muris RN66]
MRLWSNFSSLNNINNQAHLEINTNKRLTPYFSFNASSLRQRKVHGSQIIEDELSFEELRCMHYKAKILQAQCDSNQVKESHHILMPASNLVNISVDTYDISHDSHNKENEQTQVKNLQSTLSNPRLEMKGQKIMVRMIKATDNHIDTICEGLDFDLVDASKNMKKELQSSLSNLLSVITNEQENNSEEVDFKNMSYISCIIPLPISRSSALLTENSSFELTQKALLCTGYTQTLNPYLSYSRLFRESIMYTYLMDRYNKYSKRGLYSNSFSLYQSTISTFPSNFEAPKLCISAYKDGYSFNLSLDDTYIRKCKLIKLIGRGANAIVFLSEISTLENNIEVHSCKLAIKIQHLDLGLCIRELYCGMILNKRQKKSLKLLNSKYRDIFRRKVSVSIDDSVVNSPFKFGTARSSISTCYQPESNFTSNRNSIESNEQSNPNNQVNTLDSYSKITNLKVAHRPSTQILGDFSRLSIGSTYSTGRTSLYLSENMITKPIQLSYGVTVFCTTELHVIASNSSGLIQNIFTRNMVRNNKNNKFVSENKDEVTKASKSIGISLLPTAEGAISIQQIINEHYIKHCKNMDEPLVLFLIYQMIEALIGLHDMNLIHGDIKPDNILLYPETTAVQHNSDLDHIYDLNTLHKDQFILSEQNPIHPLLPEGATLPIHMAIIDMGRSLDIGEIYNGTLFLGNCHAKGFTPPSMLEKQSWLYHIDIFGLACLAHCLITGRYMELTKLPSRDWTIYDRNYSLGENINHFQIYYYRVKNASQCIKRNWNTPFWTQFFQETINFCPLFRHDEELVETNINTSLDEVTVELRNSCRYLLKQLKEKIIKIFDSQNHFKKQLMYQLISLNNKLSGIV